MTVTIPPIKLYPPQLEFFKSKTRYTAYGGARGGGKSYAARTKAVLMALNYSGIQILFLRRTYGDLNKNHIQPMLKIFHSLIKNKVMKYKDTDKVFSFVNGSNIHFGYCDNEKDVIHYQGQSYDVIFMEEATQFTEFQFQCLTECNRSSGLIKGKKFKSRMYFTCNPGGVGHEWVKRLFVDRLYKNNEKEEDYTFIRSSVYDNKFLMDNDPDYVRTLENLPEKRKRAMLYGDWDVLEGQYFEEFSRDVHVVEPFEIPKHFRRYIAFDYGLDMLACYFIALDERGKAYVYKEIYQSGLIISQAAQEILNAKAGEEIYQIFAPPDMWNKRQETGRSIAEIFRTNGLLLTKANNDRVQGWLDLKEWLKPYEDEQGIKTANIVFFKNCQNLIRSLPLLQYDSKNPNDTSREPHEITHAPDAIRYFVAGRPRKTIVEQTNKSTLWMFNNQEQEGEFLQW